MTGITLLGLGPGDSQHLTREAWQVLSTASEIWLRTRLHPAVAGLPSSLTLNSFDELYEDGRSFEAVYAAIAERVLQLGRRPQGVIYCVPGNPFVAESTCLQIRQLALQEGLTVRTIEGVSFLEPVFSALGVDPFPRLSLCDAMTLGAGHAPPFPADAPALIAQIYSQMVASEVKSTLDAVYPDDHPVRLVHAAGTKDQLVEDLALFEIDRSRHLGALSSLFVPPLGEGTALEALQEVVAHLRAPNGCPWDREQTHASLRRHLLEESYEALAAMDAEDFPGMREEFGDLLLQIVLNGQIASEEGEFTISDVVKGIYDKIVRRHPHVFGEVQLDGVEGVLANWERLKQEERDSKPDSSTGGLLLGVPAALPALIQAQAYQERAARVGFDWPEIAGVLEKIAEEVREVNQAEDAAALAAELGDLFFALVNLARWKNVDAESALRASNLRFKQRFGVIETAAGEQGRKVSDLSLDEMETLWQKAKRASS
jgi:tetrapyrrole methylase family protein/MazG family protein